MAAVLDDAAVRVILVKSTSYEARHSEVVLCGRVEAGCTLFSRTIQRRSQPLSLLTSYAHNHILIHKGIVEMKMVVELFMLNNT